MQLKFNYVNAKNEKKSRNVIVVHENNEKIGGFDISHLPRIEQNKIKKLFGSKPVTDFPQTRTKKGESTMSDEMKNLFKSYRVFNKSNIK